MTLADVVLLVSLAVLVLCALGAIADRIESREQNDWRWRL